MKKIFLLFMILLSFNVFSTEKTLPVVKVGVLFDGNSEYNEDFLNLFKTEMNSLMDNNYLFEFKNILNGGWNSSDIENNINTLLNNSEVDLILSLGVVSDSKIPQNPKKNIISPLKNVKIDTKVVKLFEKITNFKNIVIVANKTFENTNFGKLYENTNTTVFFTSSNDLVLPENTDAVLLLPQLNLSKEEFNKLNDLFISKKLPVFSVFGEQDVKNGILASIDIKDYLKTLARKTSLNIRNILLKEQISANQIELSLYTQLIINVETAEKINLNIDNEVLIESTLINENKNNTNETITLSKAVNESINKNLDIVIQYEVYNAEKETIKEAESNYYPKIELSSTGAIIDSDRAGASLGMYPERSLSVGLTVTQIIYAEKVYANVDIKKNLNKLTEYKIEQIKQDIALETAVLYINLLRVQINEKIQKQNIKLTQHHLNMAKTRQQLGIAGPGEIYRWESQLAMNKKSIIDAQSKIKLAQMYLNRLLHKPLETSLNVEEITMKDSMLLSNYVDLEKFFKNKQQLSALKEFLVKESFKNSSELKQLETAIETQKRYLLSIDKSYYYPIVALQGNASYRLLEGGAGANYEISLPPGMGEMFGGLFPKTDDLEWSIGVKISLPLFEGFATKSEENKNKKMLSKLLLEKQSAMEKIEQRVRSMVEKANSSYPAIKLTNDAKEAVVKSLNLVEDAYLKGFASTIDLIDIQNTLMTVNEATENAKYEFLIDLMEVQRAVGKVEFNLNENQKNDFNNNINNIK